MDSWQAIYQDAAALEGGAPSPASPANTSTELALAPPPPPPDTKKELAVLLGPLFSILAPNWNVTPDEVDIVAEAYADVINKYFPGGLSLGVEVNALMATALIFGPRLGTPRKAPAKTSAPPPPESHVHPGQKPEAQNVTPQKPAAQSISSRGTP